MSKPNCYQCVHRLSIPGDCHSMCNNRDAKVTGMEHGIRSGWFMYTFNFDPVWLVSCDGFSDNPNDKRPEKADPIDMIMSLLGRR